MIKKKDLSKEDIRTWESYIKNPTDVYDKDIENQINIEKKDLNLIFMVTLWMKQITK